MPEPMPAIDFGHRDVADALDAERGRAVTAWAAPTPSAPYQFQDSPAWTSAEGGTPSTANSTT